MKKNEFRHIEIRGRDKTNPEMMGSPSLWRSANCTSTIWRCVLWTSSIWTSLIWTCSIGRCSIWDCSTGGCSIWRSAIGEGLLSPNPPALIINKTSSLMLQVEIFKTRLPDISGDNEIHCAASCTRLDPAASHVWMAWTMPHAATRCDTLRHAATRYDTLNKTKLDWHMNIDDTTIGKCLSW